MVDIVSLSHLSRIRKLQAFHQYSNKVFYIAGIVLAFHALDFRAGGIDFRIFGFAAALILGWFPTYLIPILALGLFARFGLHNYYGMAYAACFAVFEVWQRRIRPTPEEHRRMSAFMP